MPLGSAAIEDEKRRRYLLALSQIADSGQQVAGSLDRFGEIQRQEAARADAKKAREAEMLAQANRDAEAFRGAEFRRQGELREEAYRRERDAVDDQRRDREEARTVNAEGERFRQNEFARQAQIREEAERRRRAAFGEAVEPGAAAGAERFRALPDDALESGGGAEAALDREADALVDKAAAAGAPIDKATARDLLEEAARKQDTLAADAKRRDESRASRDESQRIGAEASRARAERPRAGPGKSGADRKLLEKAWQERGKRLARATADRDKFRGMLDSYDNKALLADRYGMGAAQMSKEEIRANIADADQRIEANRDPDRYLGLWIAELKQGVPVEDILTPAYESASTNPQGFGKGPPAEGESEDEPWEFDYDSVQPAPQKAPEPKPSWWERTFGGGGKKAATVIPTDEKPTDVFLVRHNGEDFEVPRSDLAEALADGAKVVRRIR